MKRKHWKRFLAGISDTVVIARLSKKLYKNASAELGCFRHPSGARCTPAETVQQLKDTHFPKSLNKPTDRVREFMSDGLADIDDKDAEDKIDKHLASIAGGCVRKKLRHLRCVARNAVLL